MPRGVYPRRVRSLADRFWPKVDRNGPVPASCPELGPCWLWTAFRSALGYGRINSSGHSGRPLIASRVAWELTHGPLKDEEKVLHRCDNPPCCNPSHLFVGTIADNNADMARKDRVAHGERHHAHKLTDEDVRWLRQQAIPGESKAPLAAQLGISVRHARAIATGHAWRRTA